MIKVLFAAGECEPFIKTGGLADVLGSLPSKLKNYGVDARVIIPKYSDIPEHFRAQMRPIAAFTVKVGWREQYCGIEVLEYKGVTCYFVDNEYYFKREGVYGFYDDGERFAFFSRAILDSLIRIDFKPDIIHLNDWHTGPVSVLLKEQYRQNPFYDGIKTFFTIHNLKYQGVFPKECLGELFSLPDYLFTTDKLEFFGNINFLKWGLVYSDIISTVSETYAEEIQNPYFGEQLDGVLRSRRNDLYGIINGIDYDVYDPNYDPYITSNYLRNDEKAAQNKAKLQEILNLPKKNDVPIICMITRLVSEKGLELVTWVFEEIINMDVQIVLLGSGSEKYENFFTNEAAHHNNMSTNILFDNALAHKIYAGADFILMPSLFEPCGLSQLIALSYGTIPIVRETGGLNDTVHSFNEYTNTGNGLTFKNINAHDMLFTIQRALRLYQDKDKWNILVKNAMNCDFSWHKSAQKYIDLYKYLVDKSI
jgi:starch synthase